MFPAGGIPPLLSDQEARSFCRLSTARLQPLSVYPCSCNLKLCSILMRKICLCSVLPVCHMFMCLMCISTWSLSSFYSDLYLEKEIHTRRSEAPEAERDFIHESGKNYLCIRCVFEEPQTCIFPPIPSLRIL